MYKGYNSTMMGYHTKLFLTYVAVYRTWREGTKTQTRRRKWKRKTQTTRKRKKRRKRRKRKRKKRSCDPVG